MFEFLREGYRYRKLSVELKKRYGTKVYRLPINAGFTCPNRENGQAGCLFCDETGSGFTTIKDIDIKFQINEMKKRYINKGAKKFIAYFQNFSNTYAPIERLKDIYYQAIEKDIVQISISTRPDCISDEILDLLEELKEKIDVSIEMGLQTANYHTLTKMNRGHTLAEYINATMKIKNRGFELVSHVILNFPNDNMLDVIETAKILSVLGVDGVKIHSLYIVKNTILGKMFEEGKIKIGSLEDYVERTIRFLEYLSPKIVIHRLVADPPREGTIFGNWGKPKIQIINLIERKLAEKETYQGKNFLSWYTPKTEKFKNIQNDLH
ncbi:MULTISPECIES: TIGR01212 family radical SAM protein [unclassified Thermosipho (in: thermotogales)]|uniref:TIGR01212 family radical SAM protein n=1 Tax=unclassified Thermosipho (in: thermotogales) TaxID=2676525 RepID=UPI0009850A8F|nr:TIGR01212 family radical SAM protein [Thermosipho sp. 1223]MBT1247815.1 radical SAM protein [Thermosipho sp. 1244]OOC46034.1 radical SAM protein [Thermosipho sp. 1223]